MISVSKTVDVDVDVDLDPVEVIESASEKERIELRTLLGMPPIPETVIQWLGRVYYDMRGKDCPQSLRDLIYETTGRIL